MNVKKLHGKGLNSRFDLTLEQVIEAYVEEVFWEGVLEVQPILFIEYAIRFEPTIGGQKPLIHYTIKHYSS